MKLICAGMPKTGLKSIAYALRVLGFKVYDFDDQLLYYMDEWMDLLNHGKVPDFYNMFKDVDVVIDNPCNFFFEELMEAFPEAKVILSVRKDEKAWVKSAGNQLTILKESNLSKIRYLLPTYNKFYYEELCFRMANLGTDNPNSTYVNLKRYNQHNDRVKSLVPADKLLVYSVDQGWKPLCDFTGKKNPDLPFPHLNVKGSIFKTFQIETEFGRKIVREVNIVIFCSVVIVALIGVLLIYCFV